MTAATTHATGAAGRDPGALDPGRIRNVVLVGHSGAGKTTLAEALLVAAGAVPRAGRVEDGSTACDTDDVEHRLQRSVGLALAPFVFQDVTVNLLDTPGYADFTGELRAGLRAADAALFFVSAADPVDGTTRAIWRECAAVGMPRAVVVTRLDSPRADIEATLASCQEAFGSGVLPLSLPVRAADGTVTGLVQLLSQTHADHTSGRRVETEPTVEQLAMIGDHRNALIEGIIGESEDETLMDRYLGGEDIDIKVLIADLETAVARGAFHPVLPVCAMTGVGVDELLEVVTSAFPSPLEHRLPVVTRPDGTATDALTCDPAGRLCAEVVKTTTDPYVGRMSLVRIFSGTLRPDAQLHVSGHGRAASGHEDHDVDEKVGALFSPLGKQQRPVDAAAAGDIVAVAKLSHAETGDTLSSKDDPLLMAAWEMPEPRLPIAIEAASKADDDKLSSALARVVAEDPTVRLERGTETHQIVLWSMGETHAEVLLDRLTRRYGVSVNQVELRIPLRETFESTATGHGRHVKQSGGHGQFAICDLTVEPLPSGTGFQFVDATYGGSVPHQFVGSVEKGVRQQMERGVVAGYPVVDVKVTLTDGKAHSVDSSDMAFQMAGALALKEAAAAGRVALLEPVLALEVTVDDEHVGAVLSDLSARRGRVTGTEPAGDGRSVVHAEVPEAEVTRYAIDLRSLSHGTGTFSRQHAHYQPMPAAAAARVIGAHDRT